MGDPKLPKKKFDKPSHPWQKERIDEEKELTKEYGLKNKKEIWRIDSLRKKYADQGKKLIAATGKQADKEKTQLMERLSRYGLINKAAKLDAVLGLQTKDFLERRLQTQVFRKGLSRSVKQSRQFIVHGHVLVNGTAITTPGHLITLDQEKNLAFNDRSTLHNTEHPERAREKIKKNKKDLAEKKEKVEKAVKEKTQKKEQPKVEEKKAEETKPEAAA